MSNTFVRAEVKGNVTRQLAYTAPTVLQSVMYSGEAVNIDTVNKLLHTVTIEIQKADTSFIIVLSDIPVPYGSTLKLPKFSLASTEKIYVTCDTANMIQGIVNLLELT